MRDSLQFDIVVSHCRSSLGWLQEEIQVLDPRARLNTIYIYSKCGVKPTGIEGLDSDVILRNLANVGRCDHTYVYHIAEHYQTLPDVVLFIKDSYKEYLSNELQQYLRPLAEVFNDLMQYPFSCALKAPFDMSMWHVRQELWKFRLPYYVSAEENKKLTPAERAERAGADPTWRGPRSPSMCTFVKQALNLNQLRTIVNRQIVPVCYGGVFAVQSGLIHNYEQDMWRSFEGALSRGDNIEEGHFMERLWATLLTPQLSLTQEAQIFSGAAKIAKWGELFGESYLGSLQMCPYCTDQPATPSETTSLLDFDGQNKIERSQVVIVSHWMQADGAPTYALILGKALLQMGYQVTILSHESGEISKRFHQEGVDSLVMTELAGRNMTIPNFLQSLKKKNISPAYVFWNTVVWAPMLKNHNKYMPNQPRMIWILHEFDLVRETGLNGVYWGRIVPELGNPIERKKVVGNLDAVVFVSERQKSLWAETDLGNTHVLPGYPLLTNISTTVTRGSLGIPDDAFVMSATGTYCQHKRQQWMLDALKALIQRKVDAWLLLIGSPSEYGGRGDLKYANMIEDQSTKSSYQGRVILIPFGPNNQQYLRLADLHLSASSHESYPLNILEAMAMGIPVVATNAGGTSEQYKIETTRELFVSDVQSRSDFIQKVVYASHLHQQKLLRPLGLDFRRGVLKYGVEEFKQRLEQIINHVEQQIIDISDCHMWDSSLSNLSLLGVHCTECDLDQGIKKTIEQLQTKRRLFRYRLGRYRSK